MRTILFSVFLVIAVLIAILPTSLFDQLYYHVLYNSQLAMVGLALLVGVLAFIGGVKAVWAVIAGVAAAIVNNIIMFIGLIGILDCGSVTADFSLSQSCSSIMWFKVSVAIMVCFDGFIIYFMTYNPAKPTKAY